MSSAIFILHRKAEMEGTLSFHPGIWGWARQGGCWGILGAQGPPAEPLFLLYGRTVVGFSELGQLLDHWVYTFVRCRNMVAKMVPSYQEHYLGKVNLRVTLSYKTSDADTVEADPVSPSEQRGVESLRK